MEKTPDIIIYNIRKTTDTETELRKFIKELELGSPINIIKFQDSNRSNNKSTNAYLRLHDTSLHTKAASTLNNMKYKDFQLTAFVNYKVWNSTLNKYIPIKQNQYYMDQQQQQFEQETDTDESLSDNEDTTNQNASNQHQHHTQSTITNTTSAPAARILNNFHFACRDIRPEYQNAPTQMIKQEQLLIDLITEPDTTIPIQPTISNTKTTTTFTSTITSTLTTESFTTTTTNNKCKYCNQIPTIGRGKLLLQYHERNCSNNNQTNKK
jgi:hypothetical protein